MIFVGHDWAEDHYDVVVLDVDGARLEGARLGEGVEGVARFHALVAEHVADPAEVIISTETDRGLFVGSLVAAGYQVFAVNPKSVDVIATGIAKREASLTRATRRSSPIWCAPTVISTAAWPRTRSSQKHSRS